MPSRSNPPSAWPKSSSSSAWGLQNYSLDYSGYEAARRSIVSGYASADCPNVMKVLFKVEDLPNDVVVAAKEALANDPARSHEAYLEAADEKQMDKPLNDMLRLIASAVPKNDARFAFRRVFNDMSSTTIVGVTPQDIEINRPPSFILFDRDHGGYKEYTWVEAAALMDVRHQNEMGPTPGSISPTELHDRVKDAAGIRIARRPHQVYAAALVLAGDHFWGSHWDRSGGVISPSYSIADIQGAGMNMLIRAVIQLCFCLSDQDLGLDPSISVWTADFARRAEPETLCSDNDVGFSVEVGGETWNIVDSIFQSVDLVGRGTAVYRVEKAHAVTGAEAEVDAPSRSVQMILKSSWRSHAQISEVANYEALAKPLQPWPTGLSEMRAGGDVYGRENRLISIANIRLRLAPSTPNEHDRILQRIVIQNIGRPVWRADSDLELLRGMRECIRGLQHIHDLGWVHRDISAGNLLLGAKGDNGPAGFVIDFESLMTSKIDSKGEMPYGTAQFMALNLLEHLEMVKSGAQPETITQAPHHDLESAVYVYVYAVARRASRQLRKKIDGMQSPAEKPANEELNRQLSLIDRFTRDAFAQHKLDVISTSRHALYRKALLLNMSLFGKKRVPPLFRLMQALLSVVQRQNVDPLDDLLGVTLSSYVLATSQEAVLLTTEVIIAMMDQSEAELMSPDAVAWP